MRRGFLGSAGFLAAELFISRRADAIAFMLGLLFTREAATERATAQHQIRSVLERAIDDLPDAFRRPDASPWRFLSNNDAVTDRHAKNHIPALLAELATSSKPTLFETSPEPKGGTSVRSFSFARPQLVRLRQPL
jgi:hypothetical protein